MIDSQKNPVAWSMFMYELVDAQAHLADLIVALDDQADEENFRVCLSHVYAHLNRAWHLRNNTDVSDDGVVDESVYEYLSQFPKDLTPL